jgi:hypothetical protein
MGNIVGVIPASASLASSMPATFILGETLADEAEGIGIISGLIQGVNTSAFQNGEIIYVGANGGYTNVPPTGSNLIQNLGIVTKVHPTNGGGIVLGAGRANATPNLLNGRIFYGTNNRSVERPLADIISGSIFSYTGSFSGDGGSLTNITVSQVATVTASFASTSSITVQHNFNSKNVIVSAYDNSDYYFVPETINLLDNNRVRLTFSNPSTGHVVVAKGGHAINVSVPQVATVTASFVATSSLIVSHNFNSKNIIVSVYDSSDFYFIPQSLRLIDDNKVRLTFTSPSTGHVVVAKGGHLVSGSVSWDNIVNKPLGIISSSAQLSNITIPGNLTITGKLTAEEYYTEFVSASIIYESGSTKFGDSADDRHQFTGSFSVQGTGSMRHLLPQSDNLYDLGSNTKRWRDLYLVSSSIYLGKTKISSDSNGSISFTNVNNPSQKVIGSYSGSFTGSIKLPTVPQGAAETNILLVNGSGIFNGCSRKPRNTRNSRYTRISRIPRQSRTTGKPRPNRYSRNQRNGRYTG